MDEFVFPATYINPLNTGLTHLKYIHPAPNSIISHIQYYGSAIVSCRLLI